MEAKFDILPLRMSIASVWMLRPDYIGIRNYLENRGYTVKGPEIERRPDLVATKGTIEVYSNPERRILGVRGLTSTRDLVDAYTELMQINLDMLGVDPTNIMFHEFLGDLAVSTGADPMKVLTTVNQKMDVIRKIGSVLKKDTSGFGLQIISEGGSPTSTKWLNIRIEPLLVSFHKRYHISIVHRDDLDIIIDLVKNLDRRMKRVIDLLEKEARIK